MPTAGGGCAGGFVFGAIELFIAPRLAEFGTHGADDGGVGAVDGLHAFC